MNLNVNNGHDVMPLQPQQFTVPVTMPLPLNQLKAELIPTNSFLPIFTEEDARHLVSFGDLPFSFTMKDDDTKSQQYTHTSCVPSPKYLCELCHGGFDNQLQFYEHLKTHYETVIVSSPCPVSDLNLSTSTKETDELSETQVCAESGSEEKKAAKSRKEKKSDVEVENHNTSPGSENLFSNKTKHLEEKTEKPKPGSPQQKPNKVRTKLSMQCRNCKTNFRKRLYYEQHIACCKDVPKDSITDERTEITDTQPVKMTSDTTSDSIDDTCYISSFQNEDDIDSEEAAGGMYLQSFYCPRCDKKMETKDDLDGHISSNHPEILPISEEDILPIESCQTKKKESKIGGGPLVCRFCNKICNHRNSLAYHERRHAEERRYKCETCGKGFFSSSALKVHMRKHSGEKPFICTNCGQRFRQWGDLNYHQVSKHSNVRAFQCEFCGKDFSRKYSLSLHRTIHTNVRDYQCDICSKSFRAASYLNNHKKIHTGEKPHKCPLCEKGFRMRSDMKRHFQGHQKKMKHVEITITPLEVVGMVDESESPESASTSKKILLVPAAQKTESEVDLLTKTPVPVPSASINSGDFEAILPCITGQSGTIVGEVAVLPNQSTISDLPNNIVFYDYIKNWSRSATTVTYSRISSRHGFRPSTFSSRQHP